MVLLSISGGALCFIPHLNCGPQFQTMTFSSEGFSSNSLALNALVITSPEINSSIQSSFTLSGNCSDEVSVHVSGDIVTEKNAVCLQNSFSVALELTGGDGPKNVVTRQTDHLGNVKVDSRSYLKDTTPPVVTILNLQNNAHINDSLIVNGVCENNLSVHFKVGTTLTLSGVCNLGLFSQVINVSSIMDGPVTLEVSQTDQVKLKTTVQRALNKDTVAPVVRITAPSDASPVKSPISLSGTCETGRDVVISGTGVVSSVTIPCTNSTFSLPTNLLAGSGSRQVIASQTDFAGNTGKDTKVFQSQTGGIPPIAVKISSPSANTAAKNGVTLSGQCQSGLSVVISGSGVQASSAPCSAGQFSAAIVFSAGDGSKLVTIQQTDPSNNNTGTDSRTFLRDTTPPTLTLTAPAANTSTKASLTLSGSCETGLTVKVDGTGLTSSSTMVCMNGSFAGSISLSGSDGAKQVNVSQTDLADNSTVVTRNFVKDNAPPSVTISTPAAGTVGQTGLTLGGMCETGYDVTASGSGVQAPVSAACAAGGYSLAITFSSNDGAKSVTVSQTDAAGNVGSTQRSFTRTTPPMAFDGAQLYANNCAGCHNPLANSSKLGKNASQITSAISVIPQMTYLSTLSASQITAIANALAPASPPPATPVPNTKLTCVSGSDPAVKPMRRMTKTEYINTLVMLLKDYHLLSINNNNVNEPYLRGMVTTIIGSFPDDDIQPYFSRLDHKLSSAHAEGQLILSYSLAKQMAQSGRLAKYATSCAEAASPTATCVTNFITNFGKRAYRRPLKSEEISDLKGIYDEFSVTSARDGFEAVFGAFLISPQFLMIMEGEGTPVPGKPHLLQLTDYELASRLSYTLTESMPSDELFAAADAGKLTSSTADFAAQIASMMATTPRAYTDGYYSVRTRQHLLTPFQRSIMGFYNEWLNVRKVEFPTKTSDAFEQFKSIYKNDLLAWKDFDTPSDWFKLTQEPEDFVFRMTFEENKKFSDLMTNNTMVAIPGSSVLKYYLIPSTMPAAQLIQLPNRAGLLTRLGFLTMGTESSSPILRGALIRRKVLCDDLPSPDPDNLPDRSLASTEDDPNSTTRQRYAAKTSGGACIGCHSQINPLGFAMEDFDSLGRHRGGSFEPVFKTGSDGKATLLSKLPVDAAVSSLNLTPNDNISVNGGVELSHALAASEKANTCFVRQIYRYSNAHLESQGDNCIMTSMYNEMNKPGGGIMDLIKAMVSHPHFKQKNIGN